VVRTDCGKSEENGFEPAHGKGAAARAVFYFPLRYPTEISATELLSDESFRIRLIWQGGKPPLQDR
jgi:endonuclease I